MLQIFVILDILKLAIHFFEVLKILLFDYMLFMRCSGVLSSYLSTNA